MKAIICDICGKPIGKMGLYVQIVKGWKMIEFISGNLVKKDVCDNCMCEILKLVREKANDRQTENLK